MGNQYNKISGKVYEGINQSELQNAKEVNKYNSNEWLTFLQAREIGLKIKKGAKGVRVFKGFGTVEDKNKETGKVEKRSVINGYAVVFNLDQTEENVQQ